MPPAGSSSLHPHTSSHHGTSSSSSANSGTGGAAGGTSTSGSSAAAAAHPMAAYDFWYNEPPEIVVCECLLPTGHLIPIPVPPVLTFEEIKEELWYAIEQRKLALMADKSAYTFSAITNFGSKAINQEIADEKRRLCDVQPYFCLLQVVAKKTKCGDNQLDKHITELIGKPVQDFQLLNNPEVNDFRYKIGVLTEQIAAERTRMSLSQKLTYQFPPRLADSARVPEKMLEYVRNREVLLMARYEGDEMEPTLGQTITVKVPMEATPHEVLAVLFRKSAFKRRREDAGYILKVYGRDEYVYGDYPITQFLYVQEQLALGETPSFLLLPLQNVAIFKESIYQPAGAGGAAGIGGGGAGGGGGSAAAAAASITAERHDIAVKLPSAASTHTLKKREQHVTSWSVGRKFQMQIHAIRGLNCDVSNKEVEVAIQVGIFQGGKPLCEPQRTVKLSLQPDGSARWEQELQFDLDVVNVPRMARLCLVVYEVTRAAGSGRRRGNKESNKYFINNPLAWVNTTVFDYKNQMRTGAMTLYTWTYAEDSQTDDLLHPLGTVESNPRTDERAAIMLSISNFGVDKPISFPHEHEVYAYASQLRNTKELNRDSAQDTRSILDVMSPYLNNERITEMVDQDRSAIWSKRYDCRRDLPAGLPCLLHCVQWNNRDEVSEIQNILRDWPIVSEENALELLDFAYADSSVRRYAVRCIRQLDADKLELYLLQLVQAVKHESYFHCDLVEFLLDRALNNQRIGHNLFWHLRSEMQVPAVQTRFGIILEAYLKGSQEHIPMLLRQKAALDELKKGSEHAKKGSKDKGRYLLQEFLSIGHVKQKLSDFLCPLDPTLRARTVKPEACKVMDSKMRPLWIVFENADRYADDICVIFKNGDDLRQDMLTLQMLRVMDRIWKNHGYDFRMNPYSCLSTEHRLGMIEVVLKAETIANIQKKKGMFSATSPFKKGSLFSWLRDHNETSHALDKAIHEFTLSCAGYCVATYVLGVADRHSDNIMVKETGQLFHIDFGHILGHFKEKFGFRRERVPFVLTHDFVYIINKGKTDRETDEFKTFKELCETGFLLLRQHGCLILSLFSLMISTGLPELSSEKDLNYLRDTLVLDISEEEAREHFRGKFSEALANSWKTSLNWASHNFSKNNKQ